MTMPTFYNQQKKDLRNDSFRRELLESDAAARPDGDVEAPPHLSQILPLEQESEGRDENERSSANIVEGEILPGAYSATPGSRAIRREFSCMTLKDNQSVMESRNTGMNHGVEEQEENASSVVAENEGSSTLRDVQTDPYQEEEREGEDDVQSIPTIMEAIPVNECDLEKNIRKQIMAEAVEANIVFPDSKGNGESRRQSKSLLCMLALLGMVVIAVFVGVFLPLRTRESKSSSTTLLQPTTLRPTTLQPTTLQPTILQPSKLQPTLQRIRERGVLRCGVHLLEQNVIGGFAKP